MRFVALLVGALIFAGCVGDGSLEEPLCVFEHQRAVLLGENVTLEGIRSAFLHDGWQVNTTNASKTWNESIHLTASWGAYPVAVNNGTRNYTAVKLDARGMGPRDMPEPQLETIASRVLHELRAMGEVTDSPSNPSMTLQHSGPSSGLHERYCPEHRR